MLVESIYTFTILRNIDPIYRINQLWIEQCLIITDYY